ncbi:hypothetical protein AALO_G00260490, partial [Alosa alosa]
PFVWCPRSGSADRASTEGGGCVGRWVLLDLRRRGGVGVTERWPRALPESVLIHEREEEREREREREADVLCVNLFRNATPDFLSLPHRSPCSIIALMPAFNFSVPSLSLSLSLLILSLPLPIAPVLFL